MLLFWEVFRFLARNEKFAAMILECGLVFSKKCIMKCVPVLSSPLLELGSHMIAPIVSVASGRSYENIKETSATIGAIAIASIARVLYPGDRSQTAAIANDYMRTTATCTEGDDRSDPNCPMVHQYYPELSFRLASLLLLRRKTAIMRR